MSKFETPFDDTLDVFKGVILSTGIDKYVKIKIYTDNSIKQSVGVARIKKATAESKHEMGIDIYIHINENIFEQLTIEQQVIVVEDLISQIVYNAEKETVSINRPKIKINPLIADKYTADKCVVLHESIVSLFEAAKNEKNTI